MVISIWEFCTHRKTAPDCKNSLWWYIKRSRATNSKSFRLTNCQPRIIKAATISQVAQRIQKTQILTPTTDGAIMKGTRNCAKRRKRRISSTFKPVVQEHEKKSTSVIRRRLRKNGETFSKSSLTEDKQEQSVNGAGIPTVTASNSLGYHYNARRKNIQSSAKLSLDIDFGAWHRNVLPTLPPLARNPQTGNRYIELPNQFYVLSCDTCKVNNTVLVENHFEKHLRWKKMEEKGQDFKFKWTQCVDQIDYNQFQDYEQVVNHISNISCLTSKKKSASLRIWESTSKPCNKKLCKGQILPRTTIWNWLIFPTKLSY